MRKIWTYIVDRIFTRSYTRQKIQILKSDYSVLGVMRECNWNEVENITSWGKRVSQNPQIEPLSPSTGSFQGLRPAQCEGGGACVVGRCHLSVVLC